MPRYRNREGLIIEAIQFDPTARIVVGVKSWPDEAGCQPGDMSWGYLDTVTGRQHVHVGDWIGKDEDGNLSVWRNQIFLTEFTPTYEEATKIAIMPEAQKWTVQLSDEHIRAIIREEIEAYMKRQLTNARIGYPPTHWPGHEVKHG